MNVIGKFKSLFETGAAYIPLNPSYPDEKLEFMLEDSNASLLIGNKDLFKKVRNFNRKTLKIEDFDKIYDDYGLEKISLEDKNI